MVDKKTEFVLSLQGKKFLGHLDFWATDERDLAGILEPETEHPESAKYVVGGREGKFEIIEDYAVGDGKYYTLGEQVTHSKLVNILAGKVEGKYYDPDFTAYKVDGWPNG